MWLTAEYEATSLFSLKPATSTASGGKTLLVPTPFAIKMALLDVICRVEGQPTAEHVWDTWLSATTIALQPAQAAVVNNTFIKILKPRRNPAAPGTQHAGFFQQTISYREYAQLVGRLGIAVTLPSSVDANQVATWLLNVTYFGKRGSFFQLQQPPRVVEELPDDFIIINGDVTGAPIDSVLTQLDDVGDDVAFTLVDIFSGKRLQLGKHRVQRHVALPYRLVASSRGYSYFERNRALE